MLAWLRDNKDTILAAETSFRVDRRAIGAVIAWEAMKNVMRGGLRGVGPGKMHTYSSKWAGLLPFLPKGEALPQQVEAAGLVPTAKSDDDRAQALTTPSGSTTYIAAAMRGASDIATRYGYDMAHNVVALTSFYQGHDLPSWEKHMKAKKDRGDTDFVAADPIAVWSQSHMAFLESVLGKPTPMSRSSWAVRWVAPVLERTGVAPAVAAAGSAPSRSPNLLQLQRHAGNRAVADLLSGRSAVQRHKGTEPEIAAAHVLTPAETKELPTVADTPKLLKEQADLRAERKALQDKAKAAKAPPAPADVTRTKEIDDRLAVIAKGLALRTSKGDEDETLVRNGITGGAAAWFAEVHTMTFLGRPATVHSSLEKRLKKAEDALKGQPPPKDGWVREGHSTLRPPGQGLHSYGLAIDLNPHTNPFLVDPDNAYAYLYEGAAASKAIRDVIGRAVLLVLGRTAAEEKFFAEGTEKDKNARVAASYDKLAEASDALERYLGLATAAKRAELKAW